MSLRQNGFTMARPRLEQTDTAQSNIQLVSRAGANSEENNE